MLQLLAELVVLQLKLLAVHQLTAATKVVEMVVATLASRCLS